MRLPQIAVSLLENDLYKFNMGQAIYHQFQDYDTTWAFKCRDTDVHFTKEMVDEITDQIKAYCGLRFTKEELVYLGTIPWLKKDYIDHLKRWEPSFEDFRISTDAPCGLSLEADGTWLSTSMYENACCYIINEVYFRMAHDYKVLLESFKERLDAKYNRVRNNSVYLSKFSDFGLRRRLSAEAQRLMLEKFMHLNDTWHSPSQFIGTSDVYMAKEYGLKATGTVAHEWTMCIGQGNHKHNPAYSNWYAMEAWVKEYGVMNGIVLADTITTDCFLRDFQFTYASLFSGVRHDSGDPILWGEKLIAQYKNLGINPMAKTLLFSDSLDFDKANAIFDHFRNKVDIGFGIGTYLTNDTIVKPLNIVMKPIKCNGQDIAKLSDVDGKGMCQNQEYVAYLRRAIDWRMQHERIGK